MRKPGGTTLQPPGLTCILSYALLRPHDCHCPRHATTSGARCCGFRMQRFRHSWCLPGHCDLYVWIGDHTYRLLPQ